MVLNGPEAAGAGEGGAMAITSTSCQEVNLEASVLLLARNVFTNTSAASNKRFNI